MYAKRRITAIGIVLAVLGAVTGGASPAEALTGPDLVWEKNIGGSFGQSSPNVANLAGIGNSIVVGNHNGNLYAFDVDGNFTFGWPQPLGRAIDASPAIADVDGNGTQEVFIGSGTASTDAGDFFGFNHNGSLRWKRSVSDPVHPSVAFHSSPALGDVNLDGVADVSAFALGLQGWSFKSSDGSTNTGWPYYQDDTVFSSPAIADVDADGKPDYVVGGDSTAGGPIDKEGGLVRAVRGDGSTIWQYFTDDIVASSPAVADLNGDGRPEVVVGTGGIWPASNSRRDSSYLRVLNSSGHLVWERSLGAIAAAPPALADVNGDGRLDIIQSTFDGNNPGRVFVFDANGTPLNNWNGKPSGGGVVLSQAVTADFNGDGAQDVVVPTGGGIYVYDGVSGAQLFALKVGSASYQSSPWIGDLDGNGRLDIIVTSLQGSITRYQMPTTAATLGALGWSQFRKDARHTGSWISTPLAFNYCQAGQGQGYLLSASDGGMFAFCRNFYGSTGGKPLNKPIVGSASKADQTGYWQVASDGGVFAFGSAGFYGSTGSMRLNQPIVAMAPTPSGLGYWLAARDGGIFAFGDAQFKGSTGSIRLNQPIVGMAATNTGNGYWLVASDGGIFAFGDARFMGSTGSVRLNREVVAMAATPDAQGYWLAAADGGIFAFGNAGFHGSTGSLRLNKPIVGISSTASGGGYRMVATDGGIFAFGDAKFLGSTAGIRLNGPIVSAN